MARGYAGKTLWVDLSKGKLEDETFSDEFCRQFIGGYGLGARVIFSRQKAGIDPLSADSILGLTTGMLTGTPSISASRYIMVGKSPLKSHLSQTPSLDSGSQSRLATMARSALS